ncbi:hypothetical protein Tco_0356145 [Tanacetum coccineum]
MIEMKKKCEVTKVKALIALADKERVSVSKESARNEQRNNLMSKQRNLVQELYTYKEQLLVLKQAKLDLLTMQHVNTDILKENQNLRNELKELTSITEAWLNISNKVNQCISEQIPTQKKKIFGTGQFTEDCSSSRPKDLVFVKSSADNSEVSINGSNKPKLSEAEDSTLSNHDTGKTIKSILKSTSTFKAEILKGVIINKPSSAPARGNKSSSASKTNSALAGKLKNVKMEDDPPLAIVMKELNELKLQISKNKSSYFRNKNPQQVPPNALQNKYKTQFKMNCELKTIISLRRGIKPKNHQHVTKNYETCSSNVHTISDHNGIEWFKKREALQAKKAESFKASKTESSSALRSKTPTKSANSAAAGCCANILWIKSQLTDYDIIYEKVSFIEEEEEEEVDVDEEVEDENQRIRRSKSRSRRRSQPHQTELLLFW